MARNTEFLALVMDQLTDVGAVRSRAMFGGHGLYLDDVFFALISGDRLYFKADAKTRAQFEARGLARFSYTAKGRTLEASYFEAPAEVFDTPAEMRHWARLALEAATRARQPAPRRPRSVR